METVVLKRVSGEGIEEETFGIELNVDTTIKDGLLKLMEVDEDYVKEWWDGDMISFVYGEFGEDDSILIIKNDGTVIDITTPIHGQDMKEEGFNFDQTIKKYLEGNNLNIVTKMIVRESFNESTIEREYEDGDRLIEVLFNWFDIEGEEFKICFDNNIKKLVQERVVEKGDTFYLVGVEGELELELNKFEPNDFNKTLKEIYWGSF